MQSNKKGFTLVELLIVIGILAILATAVVLVLNPVELLAQARDTTRLSDFASIVSAVSLYTASVDAPEMVHGADTARSNVSETGAACPFTMVCTTLPNLTTPTDGTGWIAINFNATPGGSPLPVLPTDPSGSATLFYAYAGSDVTGTFEINTVLESDRNAHMMANDGGNSAAHYERGTEPGLDL